LLFAVVGWGFRDRLHWEGNEQIIQSSQRRIDKIEGQLSTLPPHVASEDQIIDLQQSTARDHAEIMMAIGRLDSRIDHLTTAMRGPRSSIILPTDSRPAAAEK
jgi:hypothetical protein